MDKAVEQRMKEIAERRAGQERLTDVLTHAFSREELGRIFDAMPDGSANGLPKPAEYRTLAGAVGTAWAEYEERKAA
jgi:hypothetical protein